MIKFDNVGLEYDQKQIFSEVNLEIQPTEKVILSGKSGSGKTSLLHLLLGFKIPTSGAIYFDGDVINSQKLCEVRRKIAYIPQEVLIGRGEVLALIQSFFSLKANRNLEFDHDQLHDLLACFQLEKSVLTKQMEQLSGGEKQRIAIIISILLKRTIFLLDEITSALDKKLKKRVVQFFLEQKDFTAIIISHDPDWLEYDQIKVFNLEEKQWTPSTSQ